MHRFDFFIKTILTNITTVLRTVVLCMACGLLWIVRLYSQPGAARPCETRGQKLWEILLHAPQFKEILLGMLNEMVG